jgi:pyruvate dehydrogenase E1 component alpha subunit
VAINCGLSAREILAELMGKATGSSKGKGGSMHLADVSKNFWGGHAIVGAHLPIAAGLALGDQYQKNDGITICMFGDGATNIGYFHEALNLSKVWNLPVLWVCENNQYGMGTAVERASAVPEMRQKADGYGIPNSRADGMDIMAVREATKEAIESVRGGNGPYFLEIVTYRFRGHSMGDPERYRQSDEVKKWQENDPIGIYRRYLVEHKIIPENELNTIDEQIEGEVLEAVQLAEADPDPIADALFEHVYVES